MYLVQYFNRYITSKELVCQLGFFAFYVTMAIGRFSCDFLRQRFGRDLIAKSSGVLAVVGLAAVILAPTFTSHSSDIAVAIATIGFAIVGSGISTLIPTMFSTAGHLSNRHSGTAIAVVAGFTYSGSIVSSPMIGGLSDGFHSLRFAFIVVAGLLFFISPLGYGISKEIHSSFTSTADGASTEANTAYTPLLSDDEANIENA